MVQHRTNTLGAQMIARMRTLMEKELYPEFHAQFKPIFAKYPQIKSISFNTERDYDDEYHTVRELVACDVHFGFDDSITLDTIKRVGRKATVVTEPLRLQRVRTTDHDDQEYWHIENNGDDIYDSDDSDDESDEDDVIPEYMADVLKMIDPVVSQFDDDEVTQLFGYNGKITLTVDSIAVTGDFPSGSDNEW